MRAKVRRTATHLAHGARGPAVARTHGGDGRLHRPLGVRARPAPDLAWHDRCCPSRMNTRATTDGPSHRTPEPASAADSNDAYVRGIRPFVEITARRFASNPADAEEIAQDTLLALVCGRAQFEGRCSLRTWAYAVVRSHASHRFRRARPLPMSAVVGAVAECGDPHDAAARWDARHDVEHALATLTPIDRAILVKRDVEGCDSVCVATAVGLSVPAVKSRLHRVRCTVRARLGA